MNISIAHLYPDLMNIYSDMGNIICLRQRCWWRGIKVKVEAVSLGQELDWQKYDLFFGGGGQDRQQEIVAKDLQKKKKALGQAVEVGIPMLVSCGTYQLFGHYFRTHQGLKIPGISLFDAYTIASYKRKIGNIIIKLNQSAINNQQLTISNNLVGFENHSGNTFIVDSAKNTSEMLPISSSEVVRPSGGTPRMVEEARGKSNTFPLGKVIVGFGNNGEDKTEGAIYKNCIGTYLHGPVLPKNPHLADWLIQKALERKYQKSTQLTPLDDELEWQAHQAAIKRTYQTK